MLAPGTTPYAPEIVWQPQPGPQTALLECPVFEILYGGARGGGKTDGSIGDWLEHSSKYGKNAVGIFVRRKLIQLSEVIARTDQLFPKLGAKWNEQKKTWTMANGARLKFVYLERDKDAEEYQGHSYTRVYIEEVTNFPSPGPINKLRATLRSAAGVPCGMRLTGNPGGPGHLWVKKRYIDPNPAGFEVIWENVEVEVGGVVHKLRLDRVFIPSKISDNELLLVNDPTYLVRLSQSGSAALVKAWLEGNWDIVDGAFFDEFDESRHVLNLTEFLKIKNRNMRFFRAFDWGSAKPFSVGWYAIMDKEYECDGHILPRGALVKYREWYGAKDDNVGLKMSADQVAKGTKNRELGDVIRYGVADPSIFTQNGGPSIANMMAEHGVSWRRGDNRRQPGWEQMRIRLTGTDRGPMLFFCDCCHDSIRTIPVLQHDEKNSEDLDTTAEDHAADETRYACMSRPWKPKDPTLVNSAGPVDITKMTINQLITKQSRITKTPNYRLGLKI